MRMFCQHEWTIINEVTLPSAYEQMDADLRHRIVSMANVESNFCKTHSVILACTKCGKLHREVTRTFPL